MYRSCLGIPTIFSFWNKYLQMSLLVSWLWRRVKLPRFDVLANWKQNLKASTSIAFFDKKMFNNCKCFKNYKFSAQTTLYKLTLIFNALEDKFIKTGGFYLKKRDFTIFLNTFFIWFFDQPVFLYYQNINALMVSKIEHIL